MQLSPTFGPAPDRGLQHRLHGPHFSRSAPAATSQRKSPALRLGALAPLAHRTRATRADTRNHGEGEKTNRHIYIYIYIYTHVNVYIYIYIYIHIHMCIHMYSCVYTCIAFIIYIYIYTYV